MLIAIANSLLPSKVQVQKPIKHLHHELLVEYIKTLTIEYIPHLIIIPIFNGIPKTKTIQSVMILCKRFNNQIQMFG
jgi:hypothetical protein